jgi:hypothetical protein
MLPKNTRILVCAKMMRNHRQHAQRTPAVEFLEAMFFPLLDGQGIAFHFARLFHVSYPSQDCAKGFVEWHMGPVRGKSTGNTLRAH